MAGRPVRCHHCGGRKPSQHGGDLPCSQECRDGLTAAKAAAEKHLDICGFVRVPGILNLWEKGGVHISIDQVMREGLEETIQRHSDTLAEIHG